MDREAWDAATRLSNWTEPIIEIFGKWLFIKKKKEIHTTKIPNIMEMNKVIIANPYDGIHLNFVILDE